MSDFDMVEPRGLQGEVQRFLRIDGSDVRAELPTDDIAREFIPHRGEVIPASADHLQIGEVGPPHLIRACCLILELIGRLDDNEGWAGDQVSGFRMR